MDSYIYIYTCAHAYSKTLSSSRSIRRSTSGGSGGSGGSSLLASVDRAVPHRCCSESSCLLLLCLQCPAHAMQNGHQPGTSAVGHHFCRLPQTQREQRSALTGSTHEPVPATAVVISGGQKQSEKNGINMISWAPRESGMQHKGARRQSVR